MTVIDGSGSLGVRSEPQRFTVDEFLTLVEASGAGEVPVVLDVRSPHHDADALIRARDAARRALEARDLIRGGAVHPDLDDHLRTLCRPRWEIAVRHIVDGQVHRMSLTHGHADTPGNNRVVARVIDGGIAIDACAPGSTRPITDAVGSRVPLAFAGIRTPTAELSAALTDGAADQGLTTRRLIDIGVPAADAAIVGRTLGPCTRFTEIVGIRDSSGTPVGGPVTVFDTSEGRIVGTSTTAHDGTGWTTLAPGTNTHLSHALRVLVERLEAGRERPRAR